MPLYGNQCPATDHTSKQTQFNASLQVVYSSIVRLVTSIDPEATMNLMPDKTPGPPIVNITYNATAEQSDITETPPMKRSKLNSLMNYHYPSDTTASQPDKPHDELQRYNNSLCIPEQNHPLRYWGVHADILPLLI